MVAPAHAVSVYTDGACSGNPGPGGWAWAVDRDTWSSGSEAA
ncbi:MAG TPA: RNase H family protein, partial [Nocardioidaceae bacterium]|nr:RNase H family protein [Nocardioidaceae bacterium]